MKRLLILGAGGFGHMIQEMAGLLGYEEAVFLDDAVKGADVVGKCCDYRAFVKEYDTAVAALGDNGMRLYWTEKLDGSRILCTCHDSPHSSHKPKCRDRKRYLCYAEGRCEYQYRDRAWGTD